MPIPTIPEQPNRPSVKNTYVDLVESIALEKMALANLVEAEAKKIQAFIINSQPVDQSGKSNKELLQLHEYTLKIMDAIGMQQRLLLQKLQLIKEFPLLEEHDELPLKAPEWEELSPEFDEAELTDVGELDAEDSEVSADIEIPDEWTSEMREPSIDI